MTTSTDNKDVIRCVKTALKEVVKPWEVLCGLTDIGAAYVPVIYAKSPKDYEDHLGDYMDAPVPVINKETGDVNYMDWDDGDLSEGIESGQYIKIQDVPKYAR